MTWSTMGKVMIVVHDPILRGLLKERSGARHVVVAPGDGVMGQRVVAILFLDLPSKAQRDSQTYMAQFQDWVGSAALTRVQSAADLYGFVPELA